MPLNSPDRTDGLVVVHVRDQVNRTLAGHDGREYTSPPQHRADALALVALLLGRPAEPRTNTSRPAGAGRLPAGNARSPSAPLPRPTATRPQARMTATRTLARPLTRRPTGY